MRFTIIVPVYNVKPYLHKCLDSVCGQTFKDVEIILVDDGSTDGSETICDKYAKKDSRIKVIHQENAGLVLARASGIKEATGDYVTFVDGDDWAAPDMLEQVQNMSERNPDIIMFSAWNVYSDHMDQTVNSVPEGFYSRHMLEKEVHPYLFSDRRKGFRWGTTIFAHTWDKAFKRELIQAHCFADGRVRIFTDIPLTYECILYADNAYICNKPLYYYNKTNEESITYGKRKYLSKSFYYLTEDIQTKLKGISPEVDRSLNDFPAMIIAKAILQEIENGTSVCQTAENLRIGLRESQLLDLINPSMLPLRQKFLVLLLRMRLYWLVVLLHKEHDKGIKNEKRRK